MIEVLLPAMGEGIIEAEVTRWLVSEGAQVEIDVPLVEVATDKVDSEIPSPGKGTVHKILIKEGDTAKIGQVMALIADPGEAEREPHREPMQVQETPPETSEPIPEPKAQEEPTQAPEWKPMDYSRSAFLSPVLRKIALQHGISPAEIETVEGSGIGGRITKADLLAYLASRPEAKAEVKISQVQETKEAEKEVNTQTSKPGGQAIEKKTEETGTLDRIPQEQLYGSGPYTIHEMDRMRRLISDHMLHSKKVAPHVTSFVESDVTEMIRWRTRVKDEFRQKYGERLTLTTLMLEAVVKALKQHPDINVSVDGYRIIRKQDINLGMATALPDGNLIVPVIHGADKLSLQGLAARVNDLAARARENSLKPSEIQGGTFTVTNMGQFGNISGTPIINQPQVAILAIGAIVKKPAVVETTDGDTIGIRHMLILSLSYDHRVVDGALGGSFLKSIGDGLEDFDASRNP